MTGCSVFIIMPGRRPTSTLFPYTTLFRSSGQIPGPRYLAASQEITVLGGLGDETLPHLPYPEDRKSTRLNSSHLGISYAVFCLKKKTRTLYLDQLDIYHHTPNDLCEYHSD